MRTQEISVDVEQIAEYGVSLLMEMPARDSNGNDHFQICTPDEQSEEFVREYVGDLVRRSKKDIDCDGGDLIIQGWLKNSVPVVVDRIPAGPPDGRGGPPINPPEVVMDNCDFEYELRIVFEDLGYAYLSAEVC